MLLFLYVLIKLDCKKMDRETKKEKQKLRKELDFFLDYHKEVSARSEKMGAYFDEQIAIIVERLKEIGK